MAAASAHDKSGRAHRGQPELAEDRPARADRARPSRKIAAFRFELSRVQTQAIRERGLSMLVNVDMALAQGVANGLGIELPAAMPKVLEVEEPGRRHYERETDPPAV